jgi:hypothetical protein
MAEAVTWEQRIEGYRMAIRTIIITPDIDAGSAKHVLSRLDNIYSEVRVLYGDVLKKYKRVEGFIDRLEKKNTTGTNDAARKRAAIEAVEAAAFDGQVVNLYELFDNLSGQREDLESLLDVISKKNSMCITMNGLMKVECNLVGR